MTPKEALEWLKSNKTWLNTNKVPEIVYEALEQSLTEYDELKAKVKRYFEIKHNGILSIEDTNEHLELLKQIKEMVGIKK